jgi:hypothetical protein
VATTIFSKSPLNRKTSSSSCMGYIPGTHGSAAKPILRQFYDKYRPDRTVPSEAPPEAQKLIRQIGPRKRVPGFF